MIQHSGLFFLPLNTQSIIYQQILKKAHSKILYTQSKIQDFTNIYLCLCMSVSSHTFTVHWYLSAVRTELKITQKLKVVHQMKGGKTRKTRFEDILRVSKNKQLHNCAFWL